MKLEKIFEFILWNSRYFILIPVCVLLIIFLLLVFVIFSKWLYIIYDIFFIWNMHIIAYIVSIIDLVLLSMIVLIFAWWIYELFIDGIDVKWKDKSKAQFLIIHDIDELKEKLWKVIILLLIVTVFRQIFDFKMEASTDFIFIWLTILSLAVSLKIISINEHKKK